MSATRWWRYIYINYAMEMYREFRPHNGRRVLVSLVSLSVVHTWTHAEKGKKKKSRNIKIQGEEKKPNLFYTSIASSSSSHWCALLLVSMYLVKKRKKKKRKRKTPPAIFLLSLYFALPTVFWFLLCFKVHSYLKSWLGCVLQRGSFGAERSVVLHGAE